jgi:hypothetical protein
MPTEQQPLKNRSEILRHLGLEDSIYNSDIIRELDSLEQFERVAWSGNIRMLFYSEDRSLLLQYIEGDLRLYSQVGAELLEDKLSQYPKAEIAAESLDPRF